MSLHSFLSAPANSRTRESLFTHRLCAEFIEAAGQADFHLQMFSGDVDRDGHDLVLSDNMELRHLQLKTRVAGVRLQKWKIQRGLLRPLIGQVDRLIESTRKITGFVPPSNVVHGAAGGVVVQQFAIRNDAIASVRYFYTDVLVMLALGISQGATKARHVGRLVDSIMDDTKKPTSRVGVGLGFFVEAKDVAALLCLAGLQSATTSGWRSDLLRLGELTGQVARDSHLKLRIAQALATLSVQRGRKKRSSSKVAK